MTDTPGATDWSCRTCSSSSRAWSRAVARSTWEPAGLADVETAALAASAPNDDRDDAWFAFASGVGTSGAYCRSLDERRQAVLRAEFERRLDAPDGPSRLPARASAVPGRVPLDHD
jgi:hypothetical protein